VKQGREYQPLPEFETELAQAYAQSFIHRIDYYPIQLKTGSYVTIQGPLITDLITAHLQGTATLGAYALDANSIARWLCFDVDKDEQFEDLKSVTQNLKTKEIMSYLEQSRRGGHLWLFTPPLPGKIVREFGKRLLGQYGIPKLEIFPKQDRLTSGVGSFVRLPLGIHRKSGKRYYFITPDGQPLAPTIRQQMELLTNPIRVPQAFIDQTIAETIETSPPLQKPEVPTISHKPEVGRLSERLKEAISVYDFVRHYVELDEQGKGLCPFHNDHVQSFQVNIQQNYWNCYAGCGGGSIIDFWEKWRGKHGKDDSFIATITDLANKLL
jgi:hypothetical protein